MIPPFLFLDTFMLPAGTAGRQGRLHFLVLFTQKQSELSGMLAGRSGRPG